jgi:hypothetical protein
MIVEACRSGLVLHKWPRANIEPILAVALPDHPFSERIMPPAEARPQANQSRLRLNRMMCGIGLAGIAFAYLPAVLSLPVAVFILAILVRQGLRLPPVPKAYKPPHVRVAIIISLLLGLYATVFAVPLCLVGSFVGPQILIPGVVHAVLGAVLLVGCQGILRQQHWARWLTVLVSGLIVFAVPIWIARDSLRAGSVPDGALFFLIFPGLFAVLAFNLISPSASVWFKE